MTYAESGIHLFFLRQPPHSQRRQPVRRSRRADLSAGRQRCGQNDAVSLPFGAAGRLHRPGDVGRPGSCFLVPPTAGRTHCLHPPGPSSGLCLYGAGRGAHGDQSSSGPLCRAGPQGTAAGHRSVGQAPHGGRSGAKLLSAVRRRTAAGSAGPCSGPGGQNPDSR